MMFIALKLGQIVIVLLLVSFAKCCLTKEIFILNEAEIKPILAQVQPKVDIHVHLEGSLMDATAYELLTNKNFPLPGNGTLELFSAAIADLPFAEKYNLFVMALRGDLKAIERIAFELCHAQAKAGVIYSEVHYTPHFYLPDRPATAIRNQNNYHTYSHKRKTTAKDVVEAVNRGLDRGQRQFNITVRTILILIRTKPQWSMELLKLAMNYKDQGVVGIDIAGDIIGATTLPNEVQVINETLMFQQEHITAFHLAAQNGIRRVVHAGFFSPADSVVRALLVLKADRISHGYRIVHDEQVYVMMIQSRVHFETTPSSANLIAMGENNPVVRFARDGINFSVSSDKASQLVDEYRLLAEWGITAEQMQQSNINSMENSFAEPQLKIAILDTLRKAYYKP